MKNVKTPNIVIVGVITAITIVLWIIFGVYKLVTTPQDVDVPNEVLAPVSPTLDQDALISLQETTHFTEEDVSNVTLISTPAPEESPTPTPSPTPEEEEQEEATQSAEQETATESGETAQ